jgi:hypothetical protein
MSKFKNYSVLAAAFILSVVIFSTAILLSTNGRYFFSSHNSDISVTGSASMNFISDLVVWEGEFKTHEMDLKEAYGLIKKDKQVIREFLISKGVDESDFSFLAIGIQQKFRTENHFNTEGDLVHRESIPEGYELSQRIKINSTEIDLIERISNEVTELIEQDVFISSFSPKYFYTRLGELKIEMIRLAAEDGRLRATTAVEGGRAHLGGLIETEIGVFQILGANSNDSFSWGGTLNTQHKQKTAFVNVKQRYEVE